MRKILLLFVIFIFGLSGCGNADRQCHSLKDKVSQVILENIKDINENLLDIYILDVEQADAMLIKYKGHNILIDAGNNDDEEKIVEYLKEADVNKLDFVIATHPDADHIGGMDSVIRNFKIGTFYMTEYTKDTKTFKDMMLALKEEKVKVVNPKENISIDIDNANFMIIPPIKMHDDANNNSIVLKLDYNNFEMLFTGDMEKEEEQELISEGIDLDVDILKVSHHGSKTSTTQELLDKTTPEYAFISVGKENDYGHPHKTTITRLNENKVKYYRTDERGTILLETDGEHINIFSEKGGNSVHKDLKDSVVSIVGTEDNKVYHIDDTCKTIPRKGSRIYFSSEKEAIEHGYKPCRACSS